MQDGVGGDAQDVLDLGRKALGVGAGEVELVEDGDNLQVMVDGLIGVGQCLGLDALGGIDQQEGPLAGGQAAGDLVAEIDMPGRVDELQGVVLPGKPDVLGLDRDAPFPLQLHGVEVLLTHQTRVDRTRQLEDAVGQRRLAVVDVGHDGEGAEPVSGDHDPSILTRFQTYPVVR